MSRFFVHLALIVRFGFGLDVGLIGVGALHLSFFGGRLLSAVRIVVSVLAHIDAPVIRVSWKCFDEVKRVVVVRGSERLYFHLEFPRVHIEALPKDARGYRACYAASVVAALDHH